MRPSTTKVNLNAEQSKHYLCMDKVNPWRQAGRQARREGRKGRSVEEHACILDFDFGFWAGGRAGASLACMQVRPAAGIDLCTSF